MLLTRAVRPFGPSLLAVAALVACLATPAAAQDADPNPGALTISGAFDVTNAYMFRGIPQDESGVIFWPYFDLGMAVYSGDGGLKSVTINFGTWNSLHTGDAGLDSFAEKLWYESDFYATVGFGLGGGTSIGATYTAYTSPNSLFSTVKEVAIKFAVDDSAYLGAASLKPYALFAFEFDSQAATAFNAGLGQADGGLSAGRYLELGIAPGMAWPRASVSIPVKVGLSLGDYYESVTINPDLSVTSEDDRFGFFSVAGLVTVPFTTSPTTFGAWNVHGGVEYQRLGERNQAFGENQVIATVGIGFSY
jgi:hypothetical protein